MTTGMPLIVTAAMKPIPTLMTPLATVNLDTLEAEQASRERSDVCAVPACAVVAEGEVAFALAEAYLETFGVHEHGRHQGRHPGVQAAHPDDVAVGGAACRPMSAVAARQPRGRRDLARSEGSRRESAAPSPSRESGAPAEPPRDVYATCNVKEVRMTDSVRTDAAGVLRGVHGGGQNVSVARRLARTCGVASVDMDTYLERREGKKRQGDIRRVGRGGLPRAGDRRAARVGGQGAVARLVRRRRGHARREPRHLGASGFRGAPEGDGRRGERRISDTSTRPLFQDLETARARCDERGPCTRRWPTPPWTRRARACAPSPAKCRRMLEKEGILCQQRR